MVSSISPPGKRLLLPSQMGRTIPGSILNNPNEWLHMALLIFVDICLNVFIPQTVCYQPEISFHEVLAWLT